MLVLCLPGKWLYGENAPVTTTGVVTNAVAGNSVTIPVSVTAFTNICGFTLTMQFDVTRIQYVSATNNPFLTGMNITYSAPSGNNIGKLVLSWTEVSNMSLSDGSSLTDLTFTYIKGTGFLEWRYIFGAVCQYRRMVNGSPVILDASPGYLYFVNGGITNRTAPVTTAPVFSMPPTGALSIPITATGFTNIGAFTLYLEYDSLLLTYQKTFTAHAALSSAMQVGSIKATGTKKYMVIQWFNSSGVTLPEGATLVTLNFNYSVAKCSLSSLTWFDSGPTCEYSDASGDRLLDMPSGNFYINGSIFGGNRLYAKDILGGDYNASTHLMRTDLNTAGYLPLTQPYSGAPLYYNGAESVTSFNSGVVDWVVIELRSGTAASTMVTRQAALLLNDGTVVGTDQTTGPVFTGITSGNAWYVVIYHRNHLPVMSAQPVTLPNTYATRQDFTINPSVNVYSVDNAPVIAVETGIYGQIAGELVYDNVLIYSGAKNDKALIFARINALYTPPPANFNSIIRGYYNEDLNLDGVVCYSGAQNDPGIIFYNIDALTDPTVLNTILRGQVPINYTGE